MEACAILVNRAEPKREVMGVDPMVSKHDLGPHRDCFDLSHIPQVPAKLRAKRALSAGKRLNWRTPGFDRAEK